MLVSWLMFIGPLLLIAIFLLAVSSTRKMMLMTTRPSGRRRTQFPVSKYLEEARHDSTSYFSVVPRDCITHMILFLRGRVGKVQNPLMLSLRSSLSLCARKGDYSRNISFDARGNIILKERDKGAIWIMDPSSGDMLFHLNKKMHDTYVSACIADSSGRFFVADEESNCVRVFSASGATIGKVHVNLPYRLALNAAEDVLYVCCRPYGRANSSDAIFMYSNPTGRYLGMIGDGTQDGPIHAARSIAVLSTEEVAVVCCGRERSSHLVHVFDCDGNEARSFGSGVLRYATAMAVDADDNIYVTDIKRRQVVVFSSGGSHLHSFGTGQLTLPSGVAVAPNGTVAVCDHEHIRLYSC